MWHVFKQNQREFREGNEPPEIILYIEEAHNLLPAGSDLNLTDVSESSALIHTVDMLFGIITNPEMKARNEYYLKCLANRVNGMENVRKKFNIDWKFARITEDKDSQIEDMDFLLNNVIGRQNSPRGAQSNQNQFFNTSPSPNTEQDAITVETQDQANNLFK